jgi:hypothetical protein
MNHNIPHMSHSTVMLINELYSAIAHIYKFLGADIMY